MIREQAGARPLSWECRSCASACSSGAGDPRNTLRSTRPMFCRPSYASSPIGFCDDSTPKLFSVQYFDDEIVAEFTRFTQFKFVKEILRHKGIGIRHGQG